METVQKTTQKRVKTVSCLPHESEADKTSRYFFIYINLLLGGHALWSITFAEKLWVVFASSSTCDFLSTVFVGENMSWQLSHPFTVRWVILCSSLGFSQSKPPSSSCSRSNSKSRPVEKWRKNCYSIPSLPVAGVLFMCSVIFAIFLFVNDCICLHDAFKTSSYFWYEQVDEILLEKKPYD